MTTSRSSQPFVAIACGGTGGHLFPGLAVAEEIVKRGGEVALIVSPKEVDQQAVKSARDMQVITLPAVALQSGSRLAFFSGFWKSWCAARKIFRERPPQAALAMGGFTSAPPILAARGVKAKTFVHESNTIPGRANRWLARLVDQVFVGFPQACEKFHAREITVTGTPVRPQFHPGDAVACRTALGFDPAKPVIVVTGGSQGATGLNDLVISALSSLAKRVPHWQWFHLTGPNDVAKVEQAYATANLKAVVQPFFSEMHLALGAATAVVSRSGASSLAELAAMRLPSLLVPFPFAADNHQYFNARAFADTGAAQMLEQKSASPEKFEAMLVDLVENSAAREKMQAALTEWHKPKAAEEIAELIFHGLGQKAADAAGVKPSISQIQNPTANDPGGKHQLTGASALGGWLLLSLWCLNFCSGSLSKVCCI